MNAGQKAVLDKLIITQDKRVSYDRWEGRYGMKIEQNSGEVRIEGTCQTLDELVYMVGRLVDELKGDAYEDESGQEGHEPIEDVAAAAEPVTA